MCIALPFNKLFMLNLSQDLALSCLLLPSNMNLIIFLVKGERESARVKILKKKKHHVM